MCMFNQRGIILVSVLIFLFLLSLLALHGLSNSQLQTKISSNLLLQAQELQALEAGLTAGEILAANPQKSTCVIVESTVQPWSNNNHCAAQFDNLTINYLVEELSTDVCLITGYTANQEAILAKGDIYRVTSWDANQGILQTTYSVQKNSKCTDVISKIWTGRLSWREIINE